MPGNVAAHATGSPVRLSRKARTSDGLYLIAARESLTGTGPWPIFAHRNSVSRVIPSCRANSVREIIASIVSIAIRSPWVVFNYFYPKQATTARNVKLHTLGGKLLSALYCCGIRNSDVLCCAVTHGADGA